MKNHPIECKTVSVRKYILCYAILGVIDLILIAMALFNPSFCNNYANGLYAHILSALAFYSNAQTGFIWGNLLLYLGLLALLYTLGRIVYTAVRYHAKAVRFHLFYVLKRIAFNYGVVLLVLLFVYLGSRGLLYHRVDFATANGKAGDTYALSAYSTGELKEMLTDKIAAANDYSLRLSSSYNELTLANDATHAYRLARVLYPGLIDLNLRPKKDYTVGVTTVLARPSLSVGLTAEVVYREDLPDVVKPYAIAYAMAGLSGYATQKDVAAIAYYICMSGPSAEYPYSALCIACHALSDELTSRGEDVTPFLSQFSAYVLSDYQRISQWHWK